MSILNNVLSILNAGQLSELKNELEVELASMKLKEGTEIQADAFEVGNAVHIVTEDGEKVPLPEGEYELEDGRRIVVNDQSSITEVKSAAESKTEKPADQIESVTETEMAEEKKDEEKEKMADEDEEKIITIVKKEMGKIKDELREYVRKEMESAKSKEEEEKEKKQMEEEEEKKKMSAQAPAPKRLTPNPDKGVTLSRPLEGAGPVSRMGASTIETVLSKINN